MRRLRRLLPIATMSLLSAAAIAPSAIGRAAATARSSAGAHAATSYLTGVGDQRAEMFTDPYWQRLHTKIAPYDAAVRPYSLDLARAWIKAAEAQHIQVLVAFYHSEYTPTKMPSVATYKHDVQRFVKLFPRVRQYQSWDEANRGNVPRALASPSARAAAKYYQALIQIGRATFSASE